MKNIPRILPLIGVAMGGVLAVNALAGAQGAPNLFSGARAFAEEAAKGGKKEKADKPAAKAETGDAVDAAAAPLLPNANIKPVAVCAPTAAELAKEAGLSPAELHVLQSLQERRGQLDAREGELATQLALMAAAEAKLDAKVKAMNALKGDIQGLLTQASQKDETEIARLVKVYEGMKPKDAAPRLVKLDDSVLLPIASRMKERSLSAILAQASSEDSKRITEALAKRYTDSQKLAAAAQAQLNAPQTAAPPAAAPAKPAAPKRTAQAKPPAKKKPATAAAKPKPDAPKESAAADPKPAPPAAAAPAASPPAAKPG
jgi:flagellar motility protein MotE (MotC chaperone)